MKHLILPLLIGFALPVHAKPDHTRLSDLPAGTTVVFNDGSGAGACYTSLDLFQIGAQQLVNPNFRALSYQNGGKSKCGSEFAFLSSSCVVSWADKVSNKSVQKKSCTINSNQYVSDVGTVIQFKEATCPSELKCHDGALSTLGNFSVFSSGDSQKSLTLKEFQGIVGTSITIETPVTNVHEAGRDSHWVPPTGDARTGPKSEAHPF